MSMPHCTDELVTLYSVFVVCFIQIRKILERYEMLVITREGSDPEKFIRSSELLKELRVCTQMNVSVWMYLCECICVIVSV